MMLKKDKKTYFNIHFVNEKQIVISIGIYKFNRYNLLDKFRNRNLLLKLLSHNDESIIQLIPHDNYYYLQFIKNKLYINSKNNKIYLNSHPETLWNFKKYINHDKIFIKRFVKNNKFYYRNLHTGYVFTNFYLGWGNENIINLE